MKPRSYKAWAVPLSWKAGEHGTEFRDNSRELKRLYVADSGETKAEVQRAFGKKPIRVRITIQ